MPWYWQLLIALGGFSCILGFCIAVYYTDEIMGPSPELLSTLFTWLILTVLGPITVIVWLIYIGIKTARDKWFTSRQEGT